MVDVTEPGQPASATATRASDEAQAQAAAGYPPLGQAYWALFVVSLSMVVNFLDRGVINLLVEPIKRDLHLTDIEVSWLMGFAFVAFYVIAGIPIARLVDSRSRRAILGIGLACWSFMTALCGFAQNFWSFFMCRVGVGVGEAASGPATYSMMSDLFPPERLTRAIAFLTFAGIAGAGLAQIIGAVIIQSLSHVPNFHVPMIGIVRNWQLVFFIVGAPGFVVAALMATVIEPRRRGRMTETKDATKAVPFQTVLKFVFENWKVYAPLFIALSFSGLALSGIAAWSVVFYQRTFSWTVLQAGSALGLMNMVVGPIGIAAGAWLAEHYMKRGFDDANIRVIRWSSVFAFPLMAAGPLMPTPWLALGCAAISGVIGSMGGAPLTAALQVVTPNEMRGQVTALYLFVNNIIGSGLGPTLIAVITQYVFHNDAALRYSLALSTGTIMPLAALCYWFGLKYYRAAVIRAKSWA